jgi:redox-sensitive bicupin YhaK (pirin superfamily)
VDAFEALRVFDSAGVRIYRSLGSRAMEALDPFLLLDEMVASEGQGQITGFPNHPHRGFDTITYMVTGAIEHRDRDGNEAVTAAGAAHWMRAGRGLVHAEMPKPRNGELRGFQIWVNVPASEKLAVPSAREISPEEIPEFTLDSGGQVKVIAGRFNEMVGPVAGHSADPALLDIQMPPDDLVEIPIPVSFNVCVYVYEGELSAPSAMSRAKTVNLARRSLAVFVGGDRLGLRSGESGASFLALAGRPLREPVARHGGIVTNSQQELARALEDYRTGRF